ncbi:MAG: hypothetical protein ACRCVW_01015 [Brevinema sp.]
MIGFRACLLLLLLSGCLNPKMKQINPEGDLIFFTLRMPLINIKKFQFWQTLRKFNADNLMVNDQYDFPMAIFNPDKYMVLQYYFNDQHTYIKKIVYRSQELLVYLSSPNNQVRYDDKFPIITQKLELKKIIFIKNDKIIFTTNIISSLL